MTIALHTISALLAAALTYSVIRKLTHHPDVVESYRRAGVPEDKLNYLASLLLVGVVGLIAGMFWPMLGLAAAAALAVFFTIAVAFHIRAGDARNIATPVALALVSVAVFVLRTVTLGG